MEIQEWAGEKPQTIKIIATQKDCFGCRIGWRTQKVITLRVLATHNHNSCRSCLTRAIQHFEELGWVLHGSVVLNGKEEVLLIREPQGTLVHCC